jgi:hypothetical protein
MAREHNNGWREASIGFLGVLVGSSIVAFSNYVINERQIDVKMVEIAVGLLKEDPNGPHESGQLMSFKKTLIRACPTAPIKH